MPISTPTPYFFNLPKTGRPDPSFLYQFWYPGVHNVWKKSTSSRIYDPIFGIKAIVIHATAGSSSWGAMSVMKGGNASWHWMVPDENEKAHGKFAWACAPESRAAWHVRNAVSHPELNEGLNKINHWSLGIEIVNRQNSTDSFSDWQIEKTAELVRYAWAKYPNLQYVVSHAMLDPFRRHDPGENFDWVKFKTMVLEGVNVHTESSSGLVGFEDAPPLSQLDADNRESVCGHNDHEKIVTNSESVGPQSSPEIGWAMALKMAEASKIAYKGKQEITHWATQHLSAQNVSFLSKEDTQLFIAENSNQTFIVFRGSSDFGDWITNLQWGKTRKKYGKIHRGFFKAVSHVQQEVFAALTRARVYGRDVYLAGHSLGGALATVCATHSNFEIGSTPIRGIYTFGMPRTCNQECADYIQAIFGDQHIRFVNNKDIVARIPPFSEHVGRLVHFDKHGDIKTVKAQKSNTEAIAVRDDSDPAMAPMSEAEFSELKAQFSAAYKNGAEGIIPGAGDHDINQYIQIIAKQNE